MNIMKTNMLLLDNRIRKDDGDKTTTVAAPVPSTVQPQAGMKALMFQGMQNLMANPALAKEVGVMNDDTAEEQTAKSYGSNVAFHGGLGAVNKGAKKAFPAILMLSTLLPGTLALTSCDDKEYIGVPASKYENNVTINIDLSAMTTMIGMLQTTLTQMLLQQQMNYDLWKEYMDKTDAWQKQIEQILNSGFGNIEAVLTDMGEQLFSIDGHIVKGFDETNMLQRVVINKLSEFMTRDEAITYFNKLCAEISEVVAAENATDADIQAAISKAVDQLLEQLKLVNQNLDTIISNQDRAYEQQQEAIDILKDIKGDTKAMRAAAEYANQQLTTINNSIVDGNNRVVASISKLDGDMKAGIAYIAQTVGWSTYQVIAYMNKLGIDIQNSNAWNASMIIAAINYNTQVTEQGNRTLEELKAEYEAGRLTAEQYAQEILGVLNDINSKVGVLVEDFNNYASAMLRAAKTAINELRAGNMTAMQTNALLVDVLKNQQKAYAMFEVMNQNLNQIDVDLNAGVDKLAAQLGCSTAQIISMLQWLGYSEAQISSMNTAAIINAIRNASGATINVLGGKLNAIIEKIGNGNNTLTQEEIDTIIALLQSIDQGVDDVNTGIDELTEAVKALIAKIDAYAQAALNALNNQNKILADIKAGIENLGSKINLLIQYAKNAEEQREVTNNEIKNIKAQINQLVAQMGRPITPQELDAMLDKYTKELIAKLQINPYDFSTIEQFLAEIDAKMEYQKQANAILLDILQAIKNLDRNDPDYTEKLNRIIELLENFKFECNCQCDCDNNQTIHEGVIDIIG